MIKNKFSIIIPTCNRYGVALENVKNTSLQEYPIFEIIVCDDSDAEYYKSGSEQFQQELSKIKNTKYIYCAKFDINGNKDYGIARARNYGIVESDGEFLLFLDDRMTPDKPNVLDNFSAKLRDNFNKIWYFGDKGAQKTSFVENFSAIRRSLIVDAGMFFERIDKYGAMTRELHGRFTRQGFTFEYVPSCIARQVCKSGGWDKKEKEIEIMKPFLKNLFSR